MPGVPWRMARGIPKHWAQKPLDKFYEDARARPGDTLQAADDRRYAAWREYDKTVGEVRELFCVRTVRGHPRSIAAASSDETVRQMADDEAHACSVDLSLRGFDAPRHIVARLEAWGIWLASWMPFNRVVPRVLSERWWRRKLRGIHARVTESAAIRLGVVGRGKEPYVSTLGVQRWKKQQRDNDRYMASITLQNGDGYRATLAELASKGLSNPYVRFSELMTRVKGLQSIAQSQGHACRFITVTAPSVYHSQRIADGVTVGNDKWRGAMPPEAQAHLLRVWANSRKRLHDAGQHIYGVRVVEPHHDGCPHWHMMVWGSQQNVIAAERWIKHYAFAIDGNEPGAARHRFESKAVDMGQVGGCAGYILKYITKNLPVKANRDAFVLTDKNNCGVELSKKVVRTDGQKYSGHLKHDVNDSRPMVWARRWRFRQFQCFGVAPIGLWRIMRRINRDEVLGASKPVADAYRAAHRDDGALADYGAFLRALALPGVPRSAWAFDFEWGTRDGVNQYGEPQKDVAIGIADSIGCVYHAVKREWRAVGAVPRSRLNNCPDETGQGVQTFNTS